MIQTRVRAFSDSSVEPTQGLGDAASSSNSAAMSGVHCKVGLVSGALSSIVSAALLRAMTFLRYRFARSIGQTPGNKKTLGGGLGGQGAARRHHRRLDERAAARAVAAAQRLARRCL